jgi:FkbM family methyltransferase
VTLKEKIRGNPTLFALMAPPVRAIKSLHPKAIKDSWVKRACWKRYAVNPIIEVSQSDIKSRFHAISAKNYWHIYINRNEMDAYIGTALLPGDIVLDIGGHVGAYTVPVAKYVGPSGHVFVFEPEDEGREAILRNLQLNQISNCSVMDLAIGDRDGVMSFFVRPEKDTHSLFESNSAASPTGQLLRFEKSVRSVDSLVATGEIPLPQFIKVDVEGAELLALEGMCNTIKATRAVYVECHTTLKVDQGLGDPISLVTEKLMSLGARQVVQVDEFHVIGYFAQ